MSGLISGFSNHSQMAATAMLDVTWGAKKNTRYTDLSRPAFCIRKAKRKPLIISPGSCRIVNQAVLIHDCRNCGSCSTPMKLSNPTNVREPKPSQLENPRMNAKIRGPSMKTTRPTSCGAERPSAAQ